MSDSSNKKVITVGRSSSCHIVLDNPNVSSNHAKFIIDDSTITLEDSGSTNGTFVNGEKITSKKVTKDDQIAFSRNYNFDWGKIEPYIKISKGEFTFDLHGVANIIFF